MKHGMYLFLVNISLVILQGCQSSRPAPVNEEFAAYEINCILPSLNCIDLPAIKSQGELTAITAYNSTSYFIYKGQPMGFEYELLEKLGKELNVNIKVKVARNAEQMITMLKNGEGDLIAYALTVTKDRKQDIAFTYHHYEVRQVLIQQKPTNWRKISDENLEKIMIRDLIQLVDKPIYVTQQSPYYQRLQNLSEELGEELDIHLADRSLSTEDLIKMVSEDKIPYTVADDNIARVYSTYYPNLDINTPISFPQRVAWAVRKDSPQLLNAINNWILKMRKENDYYVIFNKYYKNTIRQNQRMKSDFHSVSGEKISPYDSLIKVQARQLGWDWRLLAAQIYQESHLIPRQNRGQEQWGYSS